MGSILADCLIELPLMRKLNLRDNRLTDKGLMPIVKASRNECRLHVECKCAVPLVAEIG